MPYECREGKGEVGKNMIFFDHFSKMDQCAAIFSALALKRSLMLLQRLDGQFAKFDTHFQEPKNSIVHEKRVVCKAEQ